MGFQEIVDTAPVQEAALLFYGNIWLTIASIFIALSALFLAVYEGRQTRKHNRVSVKPKLHVSRNFNEEKGILTFRLINGGIGPADVTKIQFCEESTDGLKTIKNVKDQVKAYGAEPIYTAIIDPATPVGMPLSPGEERDILMVKIPADDPQQSVYDSVAQIKVRVLYLDMYDQEFNN